MENTVVIERLTIREMLDLSDEEELPREDEIRRCSKLFEPLTLIQRKHLWAELQRQRHPEEYGNFDNQLFENNYITRKTHDKANSEDWGKDRGYKFSQKNELIQELDNKMRTQVAAIKF
jgi:hypothetical protein